MKKLLPFILLLVLIIGGVGVWQLTKKDSKSSNDGSTAVDTSSKVDQNFKGVDACTVFTIEEAQKVLGITAKKGDTKAGDVSNDQVSVSTCSYSTPLADGASVSSIKTATLLARSAKNSEGAKGNKSQFGTGMPAGAQKVDGYGNDAFWNPAFGQLNIMKNNNWYILSSGSPKVSDKTLDDAKKLADVIIDKL